MDLELLKERARIIRAVRSFFDRRGYLETDTPLLSPDLIPESCLEVFQTERLYPAGSRKEARPYWLVPSPEIWLKKIIARHGVDVYQIGKCFRNGESSGFLHSPEFTMLEYYTMNADYLDSLALTEDLFSFLLAPQAQIAPQAQLAELSLPRFKPRLSPPFERIAVEEAFERWAGFSLFRAAEDSGSLMREAERLGLDPPPGAGIQELYDLIFIHAVEPRLPKERPVALVDYPAFAPCLAKKNAGGITVQRWELYAGGIELANCFSEETDAGEVRRFFRDERREKEERALIRHNVDESYWKLFEGEKFPACSGAALGLDRLIMALLGVSRVDGVLPFPME